MYVAVKSIKIFFFHAFVPFCALLRKLKRSATLYSLQSNPFPPSPLGWCFAPTSCFATPVLRNTRASQHPCFATPVLRNTRVSQHPCFFPWCLAQEGKKQLPTFPKGGRERRNKHEQKVGVAKHQLKKPPSVKSFEKKKQGDLCLIVFVYFVLQKKKKRGCFCLFAPSVKEVDLFFYLKK
jgi:hypothetical protein